MANSIEQYTAALENLQTMAQRTKQSIIDLNAQLSQNRTNPDLLAGLNAQLSVAREIVAAYRQMETERAKLMAGGQGTNIAHPRGLNVNPDMPSTSTSGDLSGIDTISSQFRTAVIKAKEALSKMGKDFQRIGEFSQQGDVGSARLYGDMDTKGIKVFFDKMGNFGRSLRELSKSQVLNNPKYTDMFKLAYQRYGLTRDDFKGMSASGGGAYEEAVFQKNVGGVNYKQNINVGQSGDVRQGMVPRRYQSFAQTVGKDIGDLLKWSIAISAIYGPINAISEAMAELIENEAKLADVSIALNEEVANTKQIFEDVYGSAQGAGESVSLVIDAFGQAFRAAGRVSNEFERYDTAVKLLDDSLVLSKLSTLDQAQAIDVLTAALYQSANSQDTAAQSLSKGSDLLDQWVRVSQVASVDIETLATGVAVLGDSAETAGLSLEQLNAMIATIAETSLSSGKESANIAKALIGNYQSDSAVRELNRLGIAVVDATGKNRQFLDVMEDVVALRSQGILGNEDFSRLTLALGGGGIRRQKDVSAFIENYGRMQQIVELQAGSEGEAAEALATKLDTVQTSAIQLTNSFSSLAQTMGNEGGLLDLFSGALNLTTKFVEGLDSLASKLGKVSPLLLGLAGAYLAFGNKDLTSRLANNLTIPFAQRFIGGAGSIDAGVGAAQYLTGQRTLGGLTGAAGRIANIPSLAAIGIPAAQNFASGDTAEGWANVAGGALGAALGGPIGALAGAAIAEAFLRTTITYDVQFSNFFAGIISNSLEKGGRSTNAQKSVDDLMSDAFKELGAGSEGLGKFIAQRIYKESQNPIVQKIAQSRGLEGFGGYATPEAAALQNLKENNPELYEEFQARYAAQEGKFPGVDVSPLRQKQLDISTPETVQALRQMQEGRQGELRTKLITGEIKPSEYARQISSLSAFTVTATGYMAALVNETGKLGPEFDSSTDAYQTFLDILSSGNDELIAQLNAQIAAIDYYQAQLDAWQPGTEITNQLTGEKFIPYNEDQIRDLKKLSEDAFSDIARFGAQQIRLQNLKIPEVYGGNVTPTPQSDLRLVLQETMKVQDKRYSELAERDYDALKESFDTFAVLVEASGKEFYDKVTGVDKSIFAEVYQQMQKEGKISGADGTGIGFSEVGVTAQQLKTAESQAPDFIKKYLQPLGYKSDVTDAIFSTSDDQIVKTHGDQKIIQYLLQQILDTEKKQLEGIYNLPEGATAWVPLTAAWLAQRPYGEGMGGEEGINNTVPGQKDLLHEHLLREYRDTTNLFKEPDRTKDLLHEHLLREYRNEPYTESIKATGSVESGGEDMISSVLSQLLDAIKNLGITLPSFIGGDKSQDTSKTGRIDVSPRREVLNSGAAQQLSTRLDIKLTSTTQLVVDGRVLATIIKPYLAADLLRTNETGGTITRSYVI